MGFFRIINDLENNNINIIKFYFYLDIKFLYLY
jgi:hypothetical protein